MPCYYPLTAYRSRRPGASGKYQIVFDVSVSSGQKQMLPCGQCVGCRLERSRQWAMRCMLEASLYDSNCFITLTYNNESLPSNFSLVKKDFQDFMKRLRSRFPESSIRYYHCGEYGNICCAHGKWTSSPVKGVEKCEICTLGRPHYHACLFNFDFLDKKFFKMSGEYRLYTSDVLDAAWQHQGHCLIGDVTFETAAYCARYIMKKVTGDDDRVVPHYVNMLTGEVLLAEYTTMSRRPGIGREWFDQWSSDVYPDDFVVLRGKAMSPPRYFDSILEVSDPAEFARIKLERKRSIMKHAEDLTPERLRVREVVKLAQIESLERSL